MYRPLIALTQGDPAGIGPELCLRATADPAVLECCRPVIIGDASVLTQCAGLLGLKVPTRIVTPRQALDGALKEHAGTAVINCAMIAQAVRPGEATALAGEASYRYLTLAIEGAMEGAFAAITTGPLSKLTLNLAGIDEPGHTEIIARMTGTEHFVMMLYSSRLAVSLATCHQSLRSVPDSLTTERIVRVAELTREALLKLRGREPRLAILGLNPHAGESGLFGDEEVRIVLPAVEICRRLGMEVEGPLSPDAAFMPHALKRYDGHVTLYHDQGLIPFKMISLHDGVNVTLGTPIIRTSVDHGTAYNIAWQGKADLGSMVGALQLAARLSNKNGQE